MLPGKQYSPDEVIRILLGRWWMIVLPLVVGTALGIVVYRQIPVQYRSETLIMVVPQRVPDTYVRSTITASVEDRLLSINEQILSRSNLERTIFDFDLYKAQRATGVMEDVVQRMRGDIEVDLEGNSRDMFRVTYVSSSPQTAQKVTERLASLYIEENLRDRESLAANTSSFIESQLQDTKTRLIEQEKRLAEYRRRNAGQLPSQLTSNLQVIQSAQMQLQTIGEGINRARERRLLIQRQLADAETLPIPLVVPGAVAAAGEPEELPVAQQLDAARTRLEGLKLRYTADHPDIRSLQRAIRDLEARAEENAKQSGSGERSLPEVAREKRIDDLKADLQVVDRQIAAAQADEGQLRQRIAEYQAKIDVLPTRESELVELTRDYSTLQETYTSLLAKREDSKLAASLERRQIGEQFRILDPASLPERPFNEMQRLGILAGGALGGLVLGLAMVGFLEYRDSTFKTEEDVFRVLSLSVMALVPVLHGKSRPAPSQNRKRRWWGGPTALLIYAVGAAAGVVGRQVL